MNVSRVALVTGGSKGLGSEIVRGLSASGYHVAFTCRSSLKQAKKVLSLAEGGDTIMLVADVSSPEEALRTAYVIRHTWGRLDLLVNNAGISRDSILPRTTEHDWEAHMSVNLGGAFHTIRALSGLMKETGGGHIINISSRSGFRGSAGQSAYSASKAALIGLSSSCARELAPDGIRVNTVLPGYMTTDMGLASSGAVKRAYSESLTGKLGSLADISTFILWLSSTSSVTGQVFSIDSRVG